MEFEVKIVFITYSAEAEQRLNDACKGEWEPYASDGSFHYFRREKKERPGQIAAPPTPTGPVFKPPTATKANNNTKRGK